MLNFYNTNNDLKEVFEDQSVDEAFEIIKVWQTDPVYPISIGELMNGIKIFNGNIEEIGELYNKLIKEFEG